MPLIAVWLMKNWQLAICGLLLATIMVQHMTINRESALLDRQQVLIEKLNDANTALGAAIKKQDAAVKELKVEADRREAAAQTAILAASEAQKKYAANAIHFQNEVIPGDPCVASHTLLTEYLKGVRP